MARRAGIRELRQHLSRYVDRVKAGETVEVTEHGRLVARLTPASDVASELAGLEARGLTIRPPSLDIASLAPPRRLRKGERPPSEVLAEDRAAQRF
ncbi:MAG TPA: type II toxin-antitoxin system prevent-host-death family antitoxin [Gaiellaceae bacterium]|nr:type II toxin-antitoxin system prevent-host-death family antitoxin [Gaiellaceae bacterium]